MKIENYRNLQTSESWLRIILIIETQKKRKGFEAEEKALKSEWVNRKDEQPNKKFTKRDNKTRL